MRARAEFTEEQPSYRYMELGNGKADVFIYKFIEEKQNEEDGSTSFIYDFNQFNVDMEEIPEEIIEESPFDFLDYSSDIEKIALEDRIDAIEDVLMEIITGGGE